MARLRERGGHLKLLATKVLGWKPGSRAADDLHDVGKCTYIHPGLVHGSFFLLRKSPGALPYDVVTGAGCLASPLPPLLAGLEDQCILKRLQIDGTVFATGSVTDAAILQSQGFPALPAV